jgi:hypothetical protein
VQETLYQPRSGSRNGISHSSHSTNPPSSRKLNLPSSVILAVSIGFCRALKKLIQLHTLVLIYYLLAAYGSWHKDGDTVPTDRHFPALWLGLGGPIKNVLLSLSRRLNRKFVHRTRTNVMRHLLWISKVGNPQSRLLNCSLKGELFPERNVFCSAVSFRGEKG